MWSPRHFNHPPLVNTQSGLTGALRESLANLWQTATEVMARGVLLLVELEAI